ncbi:MAG: glycosyltransferase family 2 protein [Chloroflexota bacterium]|nr:MAG: glycosyltransferase family 2 protein [Chloroflexota bacterium]
MQQSPLVSLIIPCRNEAGFIGACLDSIVRNDLPRGQLEILVVDGMSDDGTREVVRQYARRYPFIRLLDNPRRVTPAAMNMGIEHSSGGIIARLDAHSTCEPRYLSKCLASLRETGADNVGGVWLIRPRRDTMMGRAIALVLSHPFGAGNAYYRTGTGKRRLVDTVPFGFYRREVLGRIGPFNEHLVRGQDMELNLRLVRAGGRILLDPEIASQYYARSDFVTFLRHNLADGYWVTYAARFAKLPVSWRHCVPLLFVLGLSGTLALSFVVPWFRWVSSMIMGTYSATAVYFSIRAAHDKRRAEYMISLPVAFATRHLAYGLGSSFGLVSLVASKVRTAFTSRR